MAMELGELGSLVNSSELGKEVGKGLISSLPDAAVKNIGTLISILQAVSIVFLVYLFFLIIKAITGIFTNRRIREINKNVKEINEKLDLLVKKKKEKPEKK